MSGYSTVQRDRVLNRHVQVMRLAQPFVSIQLSPSDHVKKSTANRYPMVKNSAYLCRKGLHRTQGQKIGCIAAQCRVKSRRYRYKHSFVPSLRIAQLFIEMSNSISGSKTTQAERVNVRSRFEELSGGLKSSTVENSVSYSARDTVCR